MKKTKHKSRKTYWLSLLSFFLFRFAWMISIFSKVEDFAPTGGPKNIWRKEYLNFSREIPETYMKTKKHQKPITKQNDDKKSRSNEGKLRDTQVGHMNGAKHTLPTATQTTHFGNTSRTFFGQISFHTQSRKTYWLSLLSFFSVFRFFFDSRSFLIFFIFCEFEELGGTGERPNTLEYQKNIQMFRVLNSNTKVALIQYMQFFRSGNY